MEKYIKPRGSMMEEKLRMAVLLRDGKRVPKPDPDIMASKDGGAPPPTPGTIIHDDTQTPRFKDEKGGIDVHTFSNVDDVIA